MDEDFIELRHRYRWYCCNIELVPLFIGILGLLLSLFGLQPLALVAHLVLIFGWCCRSPHVYCVYLVLSHVQIVFLFFQAAIFLWAALFIASDVPNWVGDWDVPAEQLHSLVVDVAIPLLIVALVTIIVQAKFIDGVTRAREYQLEKRKLKKAAHGICLDNVR